MDKEKKVILHALMQLDIGGAETHVIELCKNLVNRGYKIIVVAKKGVYVKELEEAGVIVYDVPLHTKRPDLIIKSYFKLKKIIKKEQVRIVHAHARIPGFVCGLVKKKINFDFVTTVHGTYKITSLFRLLTNWGEKVFVVSEDIKKYVLDNYKIKEENVYWTINGINTDQYKKDQLNHNKKKTIVHVSRLDETTSRAPEMLIKFGSLNQDVRIIIVGSGDRYEDLKRMAEPYENIEMTGSVTNVETYLKKGDIQVGISRSALEGMSLGLPLILAGDYGYMGILTQDKLEEAKGNNFTARNTEALNYDKLVGDLQYLLSLENYDDFTWEREFIKEHYAVDVMLDQYELVYNDIFRYAPKSKILISGYYGYSNSGDDAILTSICQDVRNINPDSTITILSYKPEETKEEYKANAINKFSLFAVLKAIKRCDILLMGGGSLIQDETSNRSLYYYLSILWYAKFRKKKCVLYANGIGPVYKKMNRGFAKIILNKVDAITLRERMSYDELSKMGIDKPQIKVAADPVFSYSFNEHNDVYSILESVGIKRGMEYVAVLFREWEESRYYARIGKVCDYIKEKYRVEILLIPMKVPADIRACLEIEKNMNTQGKVLEEKCKVDDLIEIIGQSKMVLSMRLHSLLYAAVKGVPMVGFSYSLKLKYYMEELETPYIENVQDFSEEDVMRIVDKIFGEYEEYCRKLKDKVIGLRKKSENNREVLEDLFYK